MSGSTNETLTINVVTEGTVSAIKNGVDSLKPNACQTGRTTRMINAALELAQKTDVLIIMSEGYTFSDAQNKLINDAGKNLTILPFEKMENIFDLIRHDFYPPPPGIRGVYTHPQKQIFVDHAVYEIYAGKIIHNYHRWDEKTISREEVDKILGPAIDAEITETNRWIKSNICVSDNP